MQNILDAENEELAAKLKGSLLLFTKFFFHHLTGRDFIVSSPTCRESPHITVCKELTDLFRNPKESFGLGLHVAPGSGKSTLCCMFIAWCYAHNPQCNFLYVSYSYDLAAKNTSFIKQIMSSNIYKYLFGVEIRHDSRAKDHFMTTAGGEIYALGSAGTVTGKNAGLPDMKKFSGAMVIDDPIKPDAANSQAQRETVIKNYVETLAQRPRGINVPIIFIGQRVHEDDLAGYLYSGKDVRKWKVINLESLDSAGNALYPEIHPKEYLLELQEKQPYVFASQYMQNPIPAGGALFKPNWFVELDEEPTIMVSFITVDTAETSKSWNDATVFSFFGIYEIENFGRKTGELALHWLDCVEIRVEPKDLKDNFIDFYQECMRHKVPPRMAAIEKKSTGVTLVSVLQDLRGISIRPIERTAASGSKTQRFLEIQPYIASKLVSFTKGAKHKDMCVNHMSKITANDSHKNDDIADSLADGIRLALIEKTVYSIDKTVKQKDELVDYLNNRLDQKLNPGIGVYNYGSDSQGLFR